MKKFYLSLGKWFISVGIVLLPAWAFGGTHDIQMKSYFPTPHVTYNNVFVSKQFDVGTSKRRFTLSLGSIDDSTGVAARPSLKAEAAVLENLTGDQQGGPTLSFGNVQISSKEVWFGDSSNTADDATLKFMENLRIGTLSDNKNKPVQEINAENVVVNGKMYLMEDNFANPANAALPSCEGTVSWQNLKLGNGSAAYYLVCGEAPQGGGTTECQSEKYEWYEDSALAVCSLKSADYVMDYCNTIRNGMNLAAIQHILSISDCDDSIGTADFLGVRSKDLGDRGIEDPTEVGQRYWLYDTSRGINACSDAPGDKPSAFDWGEKINWNSANLVSENYLQWTAEKGVVSATSECTQ